MSTRIQNELAPDTREIERWIGKNILSRVAKQHEDVVRTSLRILAFTRYIPQHSAAAFQPLWICVERECANIIKALLDPYIPARALDRPAFYDPALHGFGERQSERMKQHGSSLKFLVEGRSHTSAPKLIFFCLRLAQTPGEALSGIFLAIKREFASMARSSLATRLRSVQDFRNFYIAHGESQIAKFEHAVMEMRNWISLLNALERARSGRYGCQDWID